MLFQKGTFLPWRFALGPKGIAQEAAGLHAVQAVHGTVVQQKQSAAAAMQNTALTSAGRRALQATFGFAGRMVLFASPGQHVRTRDILTLAALAAGVVVAAGTGLNAFQDRGSASLKPARTQATLITVATAAGAAAVFLIATAGLVNAAQTATHTTAAGLENAGALTGYVTRQYSAAEHGRHAAQAVIRRIAAAAP